MISIFFEQPLRIFSQVIHGNKIGRTLGFPTANMILKKNILLKNGVYPIKANGFFGKNIIGISNISIRPNCIFSNNYKLLEVHLFNLNINLYGKYIEVFIYKKIRDEKKFTSKKKLIYQIHQDIAQVKQYFTYQ
ncbi:MAG: riboflavin kinase [Buchnera aphidicola (Pentalonia nigronervosa)]|jgi:riboflavin kinase/FMN adenylyltransferase|uniref:riboflavin kinase n=1 Tax=Buchnera aphidicola (Pentalonia nigronervosa) TaxID=1309793 RepID=A0A7H1AZH3_9GAMM|nr:MAG: riboflavin kinase [Buchnera aphidicola (Pentalonia nigronervosa)]